MGDTVLGIVVDSRADVSDLMFFILIILEDGFEVLCPLLSVWDLVLLVHKFVLQFQG